MDRINLDEIHGSENVVSIVDVSVQRTSRDEVLGHPTADSRSQHTVEASWVAIEVPSSPYLASRGTGRRAMKAGWIDR